MLNVIKGEMYKLKKDASWSVLITSIIIIVTAGLIMDYISFWLGSGTNFTVAEQVLEKQRLFTEIFSFFLYVVGNLLIFSKRTKKNLKGDKSINHTSLGYKRREIFNGYFLSQSLDFLIFGLIWALLFLLSAYGFSILYDIELSINLVFLIGRNLILFLLIFMALNLAGQSFGHLFSSENIGTGAFIFAVGGLDFVMPFIYLIVSEPIQKPLERLVSLSVSSQASILSDLPLGSWSELTRPLIIILIHIFVFYLFGLWAFNRREL